MKMKFKIIYEWEDEIDFNNYDSLAQSAEEARENYSIWQLEDHYARLNARADNILPEYKSEFTIEYEDGKRDRWITE